MTRWTSHTLFPLTALAFAAVAALGLVATGLDAVPAVGLGVGLFAAALGLRNWWLSETDRPLLAEELLELHDAVEHAGRERDAIRGLVDELTGVVERATNEQAIRFGGGPVAPAPNWTEIQALVSARLDAAQTELERKLEAELTAGRAAAAGAVDADLEDRAARRALTLVEDRLEADRDADAATIEKLRSALSVALSEVKRANARIASLEQAVTAQQRADVAAQNGDDEDAHNGAFTSANNGAATEAAAGPSTAPTPTTLSVEPILSLPDRAPFAFEALRLGGGVLRQGSHGGGEGDAALLTAAARVAEQLRREDRDALVFCRLGAHALEDPALRRLLLGKLTRRADIAERLVVSVAQGALDTGSPVETALYEQLKEQGLALCLDGVDDWSVDLARLAQLGFHYMKLSSAALLERAGGAPGATERLVQKLAEHGLALIVDQVAEEAVLTRIAAAGARYAQGPAAAAVADVSLDGRTDAPVANGARPETDATARAEI